MTLSYFIICSNRIWFKSQLYTSVIFVWMHDFFKQKTHLLLRFIHLAVKVKYEISDPSLIETWQLRVRYFQVPWSQLALG